MAAEIGKSATKVCVITGGGSGIGLASAKLIGKDHSILIAGRTVKKLENAIAELRALGIEAEAMACDIADRASVDRLATRAREIGTVASVIHAAGLSPHMGDARTVMEVNALGTINVNEAFYQVMEAGSCLIDISSMSAYMIPGIVLPKKQYAYSRTDKDLFLKKMMARVNLFPKKLRAGIAYGISKHFVIWYARTDAGWRSIWSKAPCAAPAGWKKLRVFWLFVPATSPGISPAPTFSVTAAVLRVGSGSRFISPNNPAAPAGELRQTPPQRLPRRGGVPSA